jgi:hypothetical protein
MEDIIANNDVNRDQIKNQKSFKQRILFEKLERDGKITPTDIDGLIDYNGKAFIFLEGKKKGIYMPFGQDLAYQNLIHVLREGGAIAICILFEHNTPSNENIIAHDKIVNSIYMYDKEYGDWRWKRPSRQITVLQAIETFEKKCLRKNIKIFKNSK